MTAGSLCRVCVLAVAGAIGLTSCVVPAPPPVSDPALRTSEALVRYEPAGASAPQVVDAARFGFDPTDATTALQSAINSGASVLRLRNMGTPWIVAPIRLRSNQVILFDPGVVVETKVGAYRSSGDCLFLATRERNVTLIGYGAELRMRKENYTRPPNKRGEWRHAVSFRGVSSGTVIGLRISKAGGDGIYVGSAGSSQPCNDIVIEDVDVEDCFRQGMSVTAVRGLRVVNSRFAGTSGTAPSAGVDFEPNRATDPLVGIEMTNSVCTGNAGPGLLIHLARLKELSDPVDMRFENCVFTGNTFYGVRVSGVRSDVRGSLEFTDCRKSLFSPMDSSSAFHVSWK